MNYVLLATVSALCVAGSARAQSIIPLVLEGDNAFGIGLVTHLQGIAVNDYGQWIIEVRTDNLNPDIDGVLFRGTGSVNQGIIQQEGAVVAAPAGALHNEFTSRSMRPNGDAVHIWTLTNTPGGTADNVGLYFNNTQQILKKGDTPLAAGWGVGTVHNGLSWASINNVNQVLLRGFASDPTNAIANDWFASIVQLDVTNTPISEILLARAGQILPGQTFGVNTVGSGQDLGFINILGQAIYRVSLSGAPGGMDAAVYLWDGTNNILIANEGSPSPVAARNWGDLLAPELAINDAGDWVVKDLLDSTSTTTQEIIIKTGVKFVQEGDPVPAGLGAFTFTTFGNTPVSLTASGNVCWYGDWNNTNTAIDTAIFLDQTVLVQKGVTTVGADTFNALGNVGNSATAGQNGSFYISPNGRFLIFTGRLATANKRGIFLLDRTGPATAWCFGDGTDTTCPCANIGAIGRGCDNSVASGGAGLTGAGFASVSADTLVLKATTAIPFGPGLYYQGSTPFMAGPPFGIGFGHGLRCLGGSTPRIELVNPADVTGASQTTVSVSAFGACAPGDVRHYQLWYRDGGNVGTCISSPALEFNFSNAITVTWTP